MILDASRLRIERPDPQSIPLMREALRALDRAFASGWKQDGPEAVVEGLVVMRPFSRWIGASLIEIDEPQLRLLHGVLSRVLRGDLEHPEPEAFRTEDATLARAVMLSCADRPADRSRTSLMIAEHPHPWGPARIRCRDARGARRVQSTIATEDEEIRWSALAPPSVRVFVTESAVPNTLTGETLTISLVALQSSVDVPTLLQDPVARLRAMRMLAEDGEEKR
jgi:hypothetical protein